MRRAVAAALWAAALAAPVAADPPPRSWRDGPVRYLLSPDEYRRYGRARTPEAREAWVARFWRRLDPDPATARNEFRERFEGRVAMTAAFREALTPGWRTDRGRVLLLAGPPDAVRRDSQDAVAVEREVWTYASAPGEPERAAGAAPVEIVFYRDGEGRYRLTPERYVPTRRDPEQLASLARTLRGGVISALTTRVLVESILESDRRSVWPRDAVPPQPPAAPPPPPPTLPRSTSVLRTGSWFFQAADGSVLAVFSVDAPAEAGPEPPTAAVWIWDASQGPGAGGRVPLTATEEGGAPPGRRRFVGRALLEPGAYELRFAVGDGPGGSLAVHGESVEVPELGLGALAVSSVVPAERFGPAPRGKNSPFAVGSEEVVPRPGATFHRGEPLRLYFQLYGAEPDPGTRHPRVDLRVRFMSLAGRARRHGKPVVVRGASGASLGLSLPVGNWPAGEYLARIDLHDRVSGRRASTEGRFRIVD